MTLVSLACEDELGITNFHAYFCIKVHFPHNFYSQWMGMGDICRFVFVVPGNKSLHGVYS